MSNLIVKATIFDPKEIATNNRKVVRVLKGSSNNPEQVQAVRVWVNLVGSDLHRIRQVEYVFPNKSYVGRDSVVLQKSFENLDFSISFWTRGDLKLTLFVEMRSWETKILHVQINVLTQLNENKYYVENAEMTGDNYFTLS